MTRPTEESLRHSYTISTVSTLTGVDQNTICAWERRYGAIMPVRTESGRRRYDDEAIGRLQLLKALVDSNVSIGSIADLPDEQLRGRLAKLADRGRKRPASAPPPSLETVRFRLALLAPALERQLRANAVAIPELELTVASESEASLLQAAQQDACEVLVLQLDAIVDRPVELVRSCRSLPGPPVVIVLYQFERRAALARLAQAGAHLVQTPVRLEQLRRLILDLLMIESVRAHRPDRPEAAALPAASVRTIFRRSFPRWSRSSVIRGPVNRATKPMRNCTGCSRKAPPRREPSWRACSRCSASRKASSSRTCARPTAGSSLLREGLLEAPCRDRSRELEDEMEGQIEEVEGAQRTQIGVVADAASAGPWCDSDAVDAAEMGRGRREDQLPNQVETGDLVFEGEFQSRSSS